MRSRTYKIKNKQTAQFWSGYGSNFSDKGHEFASWDAAAHEIRRQLKLSHNSIKSWVNDAEIVEYEVSISEVGSQSLPQAVSRSAFFESLGKRYERAFVRYYFRFCEDPETKGKFKYALKVTDFDDFRARMKDLGFSSRHYKKTDNWLWVSDDEVVLRAKLLPNVIQCIDIVAEEEAYQEAIKS